MNATPGVPGKNTSAGEVRILVVDNDPQYRDMIRAGIEPMRNTDGYYCANPEQALRIIAAFKPTVIVIDLNIKGASSRNLVRRIRAGQTEADPNAVVLFTALELKREAIFKACDAGCEAIIRKPFGLPEFGKHMLRALKDRRRMICTSDFVGPDRRRGDNGYGGPERRRKAPEWAKYAPPASEGREYDLVETAEEDPEAVAEVPAGNSEEAVTEAERILASQKRPADEEDEAPEGIEIPELDLDVSDPEGDLAEELKDHRRWLKTRGKEGSKASFRDRDLRGLNLSGLDLISVDLRGADLEGSDLTSAKLSDADLRQANLSGTICKYTEFINANLRHAEIKAAQLVEAKLKNADLAGADLTNSVLPGADFSDANLLSTELTGADVSATNLSQAQADRANLSAETKLPPTVRRNAE